MSAEGTGLWEKTIPSIKKHVRLTGKELTKAFSRATMLTVIALQKLAKPATGGIPAGIPLFW